MDPVRDRVPGPSHHRSVNTGWRSLYPIGAQRSNRNTAAVQRRRSVPSKLTAGETQLTLSVVNNSYCSNSATVGQSSYRNNIRMLAVSIWRQSGYTGELRRQTDWTTTFLHAVRIQIRSCRHGGIVQANGLFLHNNGVSGIRRSAQHLAASTNETPHEPGQDRAYRAGRLGGHLARRSAACSARLPTAMSVLGRSCDVAHRD
jgi:hypothetical protein